MSSVRASEFVSASFLFCRIDISLRRFECLFLVENRADDSNRLTALFKMLKLFEN